MLIKLNKLMNNNNIGYKKGINFDKNEKVN